MAAIEMIHTYSLVHDDLPAMDNDEYRRGKRQHMWCMGGNGDPCRGCSLTYAFETAAKALDIEPQNQELEKQSAFCLQKREFMEWSADRQWMLSLRIPVI